MNPTLLSGFREATMRATQLSESGNRLDRFAAIAIFSNVQGKFISRTAETHLEKLANDADQEIADYAKSVLESVPLMPRD